MPPRRAQQTSLPAVNSPVLVDYSEQLAILLFGQLMKWLRPLVRRGDSIPLADLKDALWAVKAAWELHRDIARASGPQPLSEVPVEELDALTAGYDPLIDARELSVADKRRLQAHLAQQQQLAEAEDQPQQTPLPEVMSAAEHDALIEQLRAVARHPWQLMMEERWRDGCPADKPPGGAPRSLAEPSLPALAQPDHKPSEAHGSLLEMLEVGRGVLLELQGEVEAGLRSPTDGQLRAVQSNVECLEAKIAEPARADAVGLRFRC